MTRKLAIIALSLACLPLAACDIHTSTYLYDEHPHHPEVVEQPVYAPAYAEPAPVVVQEAPPAVVVVEPNVPSPAPGYVWVHDYYNLDHGHWVLVRGHWDRPPHPGAVWVPPHTEKHGTEVRFSAGFWR